MFFKFLLNLSHFNSLFKFKIKLKFNDNLDKNFKELNHLFFIQKELIQTM